MAGSQKTFELLFKLTASMGPNFNSAFKSAINTNKQLSNSIKSVNSVQSKIDGYMKTSAAIDQQKTKLTELKAKHQEITQKIQTHTANAERLRAKIEETGDSTGELTAQLNKEENEIAKNTEKLKQNENQIQRTNARIQEQQNKLNTTGEELRQAGVNTQNLTKENERLQKSYERLQKAQNRLAKINEKQQAVKQGIQQTKAELMGTVGTIAAVATAAYMGPVKSAQKYETALAKVSTIADNTEVSQKKMSKTIMDLSNTTGIGAATIANNVYDAISAGQKTGDAVNFVSNSTKLAKAGFAESGQTLDILTTIMNAYGMKSKEANKISDMLIQTQNKGKVTVGELAGTMGKVIPTANASNVKLEQLTASYAILTARGIKARNATTYLNSMIGELSKSGSNADKVLRAKTGKGFAELMKSGQSLGDVIGILQDQATTSGKSLQDMFSNANAGRAAVSLLSGGVDGFNQQVEGMLKSTGATQTAFEKMGATTEAKMNKAKNSIANLSIVIGQNLLPIIGDVAQKITPVIIKISEFANKNPILVQTIMKVVAAMAAFKVGGLALKLVFLEIQSGILAVRGAIATLQAFRAMGMMNLFGPMAGAILPVVGAIAAVVLAVVLLRRHLQQVRTFIQNTFGDKALAVFDGIVASVTSVGNAIKGVFSGENLSKAREAIQNMFGSGGAAAFDTFLGAVRSVRNAVGGIINYLADVAEDAGPSIIGIIRTIGSFLQSLIPIIGNFAASLIPLIGKIASFIQTNVFPIIRQAFSFITGTVLPVILSTLQGVLPIITNIISNVLSIISSGLTIIWGIISPALSKIYGGIRAALSVILPIISAVLLGISKVVQSRASVLGGIVSVISGIFRVIASIFMRGSQRISGAVNGIRTIVSGLASIFSGALGVLGGIVSAAWNTVTTAFSRAKELISHPIEAIKGLLNGLKNVVTGTLGNIGSLAGGIWDKISGAFSGGSQKINASTGTVQGAARSFQGALSGIQSTNVKAPTIDTSGIKGAATTYGAGAQKITASNRLISTGLRAQQAMFRTTFSTMQSATTSGWNAINSTHTSGVARVTGTNGRLRSTMSSTASAVRSALHSIGSAASSAASSMSSAASRMVSAASRAAEAARKMNAAKSSGGGGGGASSGGTVKKHARGTSSTDSSFIAGENGPELITDSPRRVVYTNAQTENLFAAQRAAQKAVTSQKAAAVEAKGKAPSVTPSGGSRTNNVTISTVNNITINGDKPEDLEAILEENNKNLLKTVDEKLNGKDEDEGRTGYE